MPLPITTPGASVPGPGFAGGLTLDLIEDPAALPRLAPEWDDLLAAMPRPSPFLSSTWITTWWEHFGGSSRLWLITARDRTGKLQGLAPLHRVRRRVAGIVGVRSLEFLGYRGSAVCADHLDFLSRPDGRVKIVRALAVEARRRGGWDVLTLADLAADSLLPQVFAELDDLRLAEAAGETCYFIPLPGEIIQLWSELKAAHPQLVSNIRRYRKRLAQNPDTRFVSAASPAERPAAMAALARLHGLARARKGEGGKFRREDYRAFHTDLAEKLAPSGRLYLARLECNGEIAAVLYGFVEGGVLYFYQSGFDTRLEKLGIGKLLMAAVLEDAVERLAAREFDFLRGDEAYKAHWCTQARQTHHLYIWGAGAGAKLHHLAWRMRRWLKPLRSWVARRLQRWRKP